ncbi:hypothetical protein VFPFJ_08640 [Purpureocillium lilacinum]|uniref:Uncharacterized protein n=1 Tax=Purpureocillium lilacinum TaxID=33203 RepID=A0A179GY00_PURLI|nr:hypothetical protein VFPFJ_08640 [Purpureocillium lilacinum]OAQ82837.1 hypothetical protein VFPFJ_08640 [Purpureocillium lilacinum]
MLLSSTSPLYHYQRPCLTHFHKSSASYERLQSTIVRHAGPTAKINNVLSIPPGPSSRLILSQTLLQPAAMIACPSDPFTASLVRP